MRFISFYLRILPYFLLAWVFTACHEMRHFQNTLVQKVLKKKKRSKLKKAKLPFYVVYDGDTLSATKSVIGLQDERDASVKLDIRAPKNLVWKVELSPNGLPPKRGRLPKKYKDQIAFSTTRDTRGVRVHTLYPAGEHERVNHLLFSVKRKGHYETVYTVLLTQSPSHVRSDAGADFHIGNVFTQGSLGSHKSYQALISPHYDTQKALLTLPHSAPLHNAVYVMQVRARTWEKDADWNLALQQNNTKRWLYVGRPTHRNAQSPDCWYVPIQVRRRTRPTQDSAMLVFEERKTGRQFSVKILPANYDAVNY